MLPTRFTIGLTGGIGSGKTTVADFFAKLGVGIIDTDLISHTLTAPNGVAIEPIRASFGAEFILPSGALDRSTMRELVFQNTGARAQLEAILHPLIRQACELEATKYQSPYIIFVVPLLVESGTWVQRVNQVLVVDCPETLQIERIIRRNGLTIEQINRIMTAQASRSERNKHANDIIDSSVSLTDLQAQVLVLHQKYLEKVQHMQTKHTQCL
jgi:dephospho-CoA kinase